MNGETELYLQRAENELVAAQMLFDVSNNPKLQKEQFKLEKEFTFYSSVISHSYYCIFYATKAILSNMGIKTEAPEVHKKLSKHLRNILLKQESLILNCSKSIRRC